MMSAVERIKPMTLEEFTRLYEQEGPFEIIDDIRIPLMPPIALHVLTASFLFNLLYRFCTLHDLGMVFAEAPFVLIDKSDWVKGSRVPDLMFFSKERWQAYISETKDWQFKPFVLVPDLAIEILSPHDVFSEVQAKVTGYLADGVKLVWVVDPMRKRVTVYQGDRFATLMQADTLTGEEIVRGFELHLTALFSVAG